MYNKQAASRVSTQPAASLLKKTSSKIQDGDKDPKKIRPFNPLEYLYTGLKLEQIIEFKIAFDNFDLQNTGEASISEIRDAFINMGFSQNSTSVLKLLDHLDQKNNGTLLFKEFINIATIKLDDEKWSRENSDAIFSIYDSSGQGKFSLQDLLELNKDMGEKFSNDELKYTFKKSDFDKDGYITQEDFYYIIIGQGKEHQKQIMTKAQEQKKYLPIQSKNASFRSQTNVRRSVRF